jgi:hypothetical protein
MPKFIVTVAFVVEAEDMGHWDAKSCAVSFVKHRIDEGYRMSENIETWDLVSVEPTP